MNKPMPKTRSRPVAAITATALAAFTAGMPMPVSADSPLNLSQTPLFIVGNVKPNILVVLDNSQSMDGYMDGQMVAGSDPSTRSNIARGVITSSMASYRGSFQWGLASFGIKGTPALFTTYAYYFGDDDEVVFTSGTDCVKGISSSLGLPCVANPEPSNGFDYITYSHSSDDANINDVLYTGDYGAQLWGVGVSGTTKYHVYADHLATAGAGWDTTSFSGEEAGSPWQFSATDAGFLPQTPPDDRIFWLKRAWGYNNNITGAGVINQPVAADSSSQYNSLVALLAPETSSAGSGELKDAAVFTPLEGTMTTAKNYFINQLSGQPTPITDSCQKSYVLLATDGNPTGMTNGQSYSLAQEANVCDANGQNCTALGVAPQNTVNAIAALRSLTVSGFPKAFDVQTYVIGMGDTVSNNSSIYTLNAMAAAGGTSTAYLAGDQASLANAFASITNQINTNPASASAVSVNGGSFSTNSQVYEASFMSADWSGEVVAYGLNGDGSANLSNVKWDTSGPQGTMTATALDAGNKRAVISYNRASGQGVPFVWPGDPAHPQPTDIDPSLVTGLNNSIAGTADGFGALRLAYLRGDQSHEAAICGTGCTPVTFRNRPHTLLGDIVDSAPIYVGGGLAGYKDTMEVAPYSTYAAQRALQTPVVYVGANDGMLHAFNASTASPGTEMLAYVPTAVAAKLSAYTDPAYSHLYTVDGTPGLGDVFFESAGAWHTLLVSGMNAGAPGLFALDVSNPANFSEANASKLVQWETPSDPDIGYIFSQPTMVKTRTGRWMALAGNGYNSANGHAVLLAIDVESGAITKIDTRSGSSASPNGLSGVAVISLQGDGIADVVYAGDLLGHLWKFDLTAASSGAWNVAYGAPLFTTASGQPITSAPDMAAMPLPQVGSMVVFGTGRYLANGDTAPEGTQAIYGIWDNNVSPVAGLSQLVQQAVYGTGTNAAGQTFRLTTSAVGLPVDSQVTGDGTVTPSNYQALDRGWFMNLPDSGERVVSQPSIRYGLANVSSIVPNTSDPCVGGGTGWLTAVDVYTGNRDANDTFDTNNDGKIDKSDYITFTGVQGSLNASAVQTTSMTSSPTMTDNGSIQSVSMGGLTPGATGAAGAGGPSHEGEAGNTIAFHRAAWEQLND